MTTIQLFWLILGTSWAIFELVIAVKTRVKIASTTQLEYRSERLIWLVVAIALFVSLSIKQVHWATLPIEPLNRQIIAVTFFIIGITVRCYAVFSLGQFFSTTVTTKYQHLLIEKGPYQYIRHPAYTGLLVSFFAAGFAMGDGLALLALLCPVTYVLAKRIRFEEHCLSAHFGKPYSDYCLRTWKLFPWLY